MLFGAVVHIPEVDHRPDRRGADRPVAVVVDPPQAHGGTDNPIEAARARRLAERGREHQLQQVVAQHRQQDESGHGGRKQRLAASGAPIAMLFCPPANSIAIRSRGVEPMQRRASSHAPPNPNRRNAIDERRPARASRQDRSCPRCPARPPPKTRRRPQSRSRCGPSMSRASRCSRTRCPMRFCAQLPDA